MFNRFIRWVQGKKLEDIIPEERQKIPNILACEEEKVGEAGVLYHLKLEEVFIDHDKKIRVCKIAFNDRPSIANIEAEADNITILLLGETGHGKTTTVDAFVNVIYGVEFTDSFRYTTTKHNREGNQPSGDSQTKWVTVYNIPYIPKASLVPCTVRIIDTPGYCDTGNISTDHQIVQEQLKCLMKVVKKSENDEVDLLTNLTAIFLVINATTTRWTSTFKYVIWNCLSFLGKDLKNNIFLLGTFTDSKNTKKNFKKFIEDSDIPIRKEHITFVNFSLLWDCSQNYMYHPEQFHSDSDDETVGLPEIITDNKNKYKRVLQSPVKKCLEKILEIKPISTNKTYNVIMKKIYLTALCDKLMFNVKSACMIVQSKENLRQQIELLKNDMDANKNHSITYKTMVTWKLPVTDDDMALVCDICKMTCFVHNEDINVGEEQFLEIFDSDGQCKKCTNRCHYSDHLPSAIYDNTEEQEVTEYLPDLMQKYQEASRQKLSLEDLCRKLEKDEEKVVKTYKAYVGRMKEALSKLSAISLMSPTTCETDFLEQAIQQESAQNPGSYERIKCYNSMKRRLEIQDGIQHGSIKRNSNVSVLSSALTDI